MINEKDEKGASLFETLIFRAIDEKGRPAWPERFSLPYLCKLKSQIGSFAFQAEYMNDPKDDEHGIKEEWIVSWPDKRDRETPDVISIYTDPSVGQSVAHDFKATVVVGLFGKNLDVLWARVRRESISSMIGAVFDLYEKYTTLYPSAKIFTGFESNGFQSVLKGAYEEEEQSRNIRIPLFLINNKTSKMLRIESLFSPIERGIIRFKPATGEQNLLIEQIVYLGSSGMHDDGPDALAGAVSLLESKTRNKTGYESVSPRRTLSRPFPPSKSRNELSEII
jgi:hypothetical protein